MIPINSINRITFVMKTQCVYCKVGIEFFKHYLQHFKFQSVEVVGFISHPAFGQSRSKECINAFLTLLV